MEPSCKYHVWLFASLFWYTSRDLSVGSYADFAFAYDSLHTANASGLDQSRTGVPP